MSGHLKDWRASLLALGPCREAIEWLATQPDAATAWAACQRGDWMLWLCGKLAGKPWSQARRKLVLATCKCARLALPHVKSDELRPLKVIETAERWARGDRRITRKMVQDAAAYASYATATAKLRQ